MAAADPLTLPHAAPNASDSGRPRLVLIDLLRGAAIVAMVVYHTAFDLYADRLIATDIIDDIGWKALARSTAGTFLMLVGVGLVLATRSGFQPARYFRRLGFIAVGAALVSLATWWFDPATFVFFGILHEIAVASVLALPFLMAPSAVVIVVAAAVVALPFYYASPFFDTPALWWVGLSTANPATVDYVPVFPWFGLVLAGIVLGRLALRYQAAIARFQPRNRLARGLAFGGRHALLIYLVHQPLIVGALSVAMLVLPPPSKELQRARFIGQCSAACGTPGSDAGYCSALCGCMFDGLWGTDLYTVKSFADMTEEQRTRWNGLIDACEPAK